MAFNFCKSDLYRYTGKTDFKTFLRTYYDRPEFRAVFYFRLTKVCKGKVFFGWFSRFMLRRISYRFHTQIFPEMQIGEGFFIGHFGNMGINDRTVIGKNFNIANGVAIGQANRGKLKGAPVIGDNVWIGPNAVVVGGIKIGNDVMIAPGAFVNFDVPDHSIVIGNPGVIKYKENATEGYINNRV